MAAVAPFLKMFRMQICTNLMFLCNSEHNTRNLAQILWNSNPTDLLNVTQLKNISMKPQDVYFK